MVGDTLGLVGARGRAGCSKICWPLTLQRINCRLGAIEVNAGHF